MSYITLKRDAFTREDSIRCIEEFHEHRQEGGCAECNSFRRNKKLFRYGYELHSGRSYWDSKAFCSIDCQRAYYRVRS